MNQSDLNIILKPVAAVYNRQLSAEAVAGYFMTLRSYTRLQVANAVAAACGIMITRPPLTAERVLEALRRRPCGTPEEAA